MTYNNYGEIKLAVDDYLNKTNQKTTLNQNFFILDTVRKCAFKKESINNIKEFKVVPLYIPKILIAFFINIYKKRYKKVLFPDFLIQVGFIDLGAAYNTRGVQIKLYDFENNRVDCHILKFVSSQFIEKELYIYDKYSYLKSIPSLMNRWSQGTYQREYVKGRTCSYANEFSLKYFVLQILKRNCNTVQNGRLYNQLLDDLMCIYQEENIQTKPTKEFVDNRIKLIEEYIHIDIKNVLMTHICKLDKEVKTVNAHGDFAFRNIVFSKIKASLIDWERFSRFSVFYDIGNLIFNCCRDGGVKEFEKVINSSFIKDFITKVEVTTNIQINDKLLSYYTLFLLDRLAFEKELYVRNPLRFKKFLEIWNFHINRIELILN